MLQKHVRRYLFVVLAVLMVVCSLSFIACTSQNTDKLEIETQTQSVTFRMGDSINVYDFIVVEDDVQYSFVVTNPDGQATTVEGQTFLANASGNYKIKVTAKKGTAVVEKEITIPVIEVKPLLILYNTIEISLTTKMAPTMLINRFEPFVYAPDTSYDLYFSQFTLYKEFGTTSEEYIIDNGQTNKYYDGSRFSFLDEGKYIFKLVLKSDGGISEGEGIVEVREDYGAMDVLTGKVATYNKDTKTVTWDAVDGAAYYKVNIDKKNVIVRDATSLCITDYLVKEFQHFDLNIAAIDSDDVRLGKMVVSKVVIAPEGFDGMVLKDGVTLDKQTRTVTMNTYSVWGRNAEFMDLYSKDVNQSGENDYVAFYGDYGVGTYVDFTFTGNNMPTLRYFANTLDGKICSHKTGNSEGNKGLIAINGVTSLSTDGGPTCLTDQDSYAIGGPNCLGEGYYESVKYVSGDAAIMYNNYYYTNYPYLTMQGLMENPDTEFKYTFGTQEDSKDGTLLVHIILCKKVSGEWVEVYNIEYDTAESVDEFQAGNIIALGCEKGEGTTTFTISQPYHVDPRDYGIDIKGYNAKIIDTNTVSLGTDSIYDKYIDATDHYVDYEENAYIAFEGNYGAGYYVDLEFTGNNMPVLRFFANNINGYVTNYVKDNTGILVSGGFDCANASNSDNVTYAVMPDMLTTHYGQWDVLNAEFYQYLGAMCGNGRTNPNTKYKYTVGTSLDVDNTIIVNAWLYEMKNSEYVLINSISLDTDRAISYYTGKNIIVLSPLKHFGENTVIKYSIPYEREEDTIVYANATIAENGEISLHTKEVPEVEVEPWVYNALLDDKIGGYIGYKGNYGVGYFMDFEFVGNNMPIVRFFANSIDGYLTKDVNTAAKGMVIANGYISKNITYDNQYNQYARIYYDMVGKYTGNTNICSYLYPPMYDTIGGYSWYNNLFWNAREDEFGMYRLSCQPEDKFKYTVGTYEEVDGTLIVYMELYKWNTNTSAYELVENRSKDTGLTASNYSGNIVVLSALKWWQAANTTFTTSGPYLKDIATLPVISSNMMVKGDGSVLTVANVVSDDGATVNFDGDANSTGYIGYNNYQVGQYFDFEFNGNNMPIVRFFGNEINGYLTKSVDANAKGIVVMNGAITTNTASSNQYQLYMRVYYDMIDGAKWFVAPYTCTTEYGSGLSWNLLQSATEDKFGMYSINQDSSIRYKYTVGTYLCTNNTVGVHIILYKAVNNGWEFIEERTVNTGKDLSYYTGTKAIVIQPKNGYFGQFKYSGPYVGSFTFRMNNAWRTADGNITFLTERDNTTTWNINEAYLNPQFGNGHAYVGFDGSYDVGTYVDIEFKGKNMPVVRFFANTFDGDYRAADNSVTGMYFLPGRYTGSSESSGMYTWGVNFYQGYSGWKNWMPNGIDTKCNPIANPMSLFALDANTYYKYTIGTYLDNDNHVVIEYHLYGKATEDGEYVEIIPSAEVLNDPITTLNHYDTGKTMEELGFTANSIMYRPADCSENYEVLVQFKVSDPYTKTNE